MAPADPSGDNGQPRPPLAIPRVTPSELHCAIRRVDTSLTVTPAAEANAITRVDTSPLADTSGDGGGSSDSKERGKDAGDSDGISWRDLHDAIQRVDTSPVVGATDGHAGATMPAAAAALPSRRADPDDKDKIVTNADDDVAGDGGSDARGDAAPGTPGATAPSGLAAALRQRPPRPSKAQLRHMREGMRAARAASAGGGGGGGDVEEDGSDGEVRCDEALSATGGRHEGRSGGRGGGGGGVTMPTPRVVMDVDPAGAVGVVQTPGPAGNSFVRGHPPPAGGAPDSVKSFAE
ncbi:hypothetical protein MMPV_000750 [Pyropia vietnamensis]